MALEIHHNFTILYVYFVHDSKVFEKKLYFRYVTYILALFTNRLAYNNSDNMHFLTIIKKVKHMHNNYE